MKVAVIGGTGFVGSYLIDELLAQGHEPSVLVRPGSESRLRQAQRCGCVSGEVSNDEALRATLADCDAAVYNVGILRELPARGITYAALHFEGAKRTMEQAQAAGVRRFLLMSANGVKADGTGYQQTKYMAEQYLQATALDWTIFRPSVLFGDPRGRMEFATRLCNEIIRAPLPLPLFHEGLLPFNAGRFRLAPVHATDVARAFVTSLTMPGAVRQVYPLCGPDALEWRVILKIIARAAGRKKWSLPAPVWPLKLIGAFLDRFELFPITRDQLTMLLEGNTCDDAQALARFGIEPIAFDEQSLRYLGA